MSDLAVILNAIAAILWPICILIIAYIFRKEIKKCIISKISLKHRVKDNKTSVNINIEGGRNKSKDEYDIVNEIPVCKNIKSGKYFIVLDDYDNDEILLVTPSCETKRLEKSLFNDIEQKDITELMRDHHLTPDQVDIYNEYINDKEKETDVAAPRPTNGIEPEYIRTYRKMLNNRHTMPSTMLRIIKDNGEIKWVDLIEKLTNFGYVGTGGSLGASLRVLYIDGYVDVHGTGDYKTVIYNNRTTA